MIIACELQFSSWKTKTSKSKWNTQGIHYIHWQQQLQESAKSKEEEKKNQAKKWNKNYRFDYFQGTTRHAYYGGAAAVLGANCANSISEIEAINFKKGLETRMVLLPFGLASQKLFHTTTQNTMMVFVLHQT